MNDTIIASRICALTGKSFSISQKDDHLYQKIGPTFDGKHFSIPYPDLCPEMRYMNRLSWRNERNFFSRKCSLSGKSIISVHQEVAPFPVYEQEVWWSDDWSPYDYGVDFDFDRPFFDQWIELYRRVPQIALNVPFSENSKYCNQSQRIKDCYLVFCSDQSKECLYGMWNSHCEMCIDCSYVDGCQYCYECLHLDTCNSCFYSQNLINCSDVWQSRNLIGCQHCFGCSNLKNKQYYIFNEPHKKEQFEAKMKDLLGDLDLLSKLETFFQNQPVKYYEGFQIEDSNGDYLRNVKQTENCYNCRDCEVLRHSQDAHEETNCIDLTETLSQDFCISIEGSCANSNCGFCAKIFEVSDVWYSSHIYNSKKVFGSVGIKSGKCTIFNTSYGVQEYDQMARKVCEHMMKTGEFGKHFPIAKSPFFYNDTTAQEYFPMTGDQARKLGWRWKDQAVIGQQEAPYEKDITKYDEGIVGTEEAKRNIDHLLQTPLICERSGQSFRLQKRELAFYVENGLPIPTKHPHIRYRERMNKRNPRMLKNGKCSRCEEDFMTTSSAGKIVCCESCFQDEII